MRTSLRLAAFAASLFLTLPALGRQATTNPAVPATPAPPAPATPVAGAAQRGWWNEAVFYEVFVRSFADSTTGPLANDGIGDFQGLIGKLDYLKSLGIGALWLMPITQSPSYHGYDTTDYRTIESDYGTNDDFKRFMAECHKRDIKVVIDMVLNHCSDEHPWFKEASSNPKSPKRDWFIWESTRPTWKGPWNETVWHANPDRSQHDFYYGMFNHDMPDLNYRNKELTAEIHGTAKFWLTEMGVDGFRLDAIRHLIEDGQVQENTPETHAWLKEFQAYCKSVKPDCFTVGEIWASTADIAGYVNTREMDSAFEFELEGKLMEAVKNGKAAPLAQALTKSWGAFPRGMYSTFLTNHDQGRVMTYFKGDQKKARAAATILLTTPGIPFLYYGEEIGMAGDKPDPKIRTPMQWTADETVGFTAGKPWAKPNADAKTVNVAAQKDGLDTLLDHYRQLIHYRNTVPAFNKGELDIVPQENPAVLAYTRTVPDDSLLVVVNLGQQAVNRKDITITGLPRGYRLGGVNDGWTTGSNLESTEGRIAPGEAWIVRLVK